MRLNQYISSAGFCSRRRAEQFIKQGQVTINGEIALLREDVAAGDVVKVAGELILAKENKIYLIFNKPPGITCTAASHIEGNIINYINYPERIFPVGRLDKQSEGLILLTNDGSIVNDLLKVENNQEKDYLVTVNREITEEFIRKMASGVNIYNPRKKDYQLTKQCNVSKISTYQFKITLSQGLNRQIRRMCRRFQYTVTKLQRVRIKNISLNQLEVGEWRHLTTDEIAGLS